MRTDDDKREDIRCSILLLRQDAEDRGMTALTIAYGWAAIRLGFEGPSQDRRT